MIEYFTSHYWLIWSSLAIVFLLSELTTGGFYLLCLSFGALLTVPFSLFIESQLALIVIFCTASIIALFSVRPTLLKMELEKATRKSNGDALIGVKGTVTEDIQANGYGRVLAGGDDWKAETADGSPLPVGTKVRVVKIESIIITVEKI